MATTPGYRTEYDFETGSYRTEYDFADSGDCRACGEYAEKLGEDGLCERCENARDDMADRRFEAARED